jgi:hypothetical protein
MCSCFDVAHVQGLSAAVSACERWMEQRASVGAVVAQLWQERRLGSS